VWNYPNRDDRATVRFPVSVVIAYFCAETHLEPAIAPNFCAHVPRSPAVWMERLSPVRWQEAEQWTIRPRPEQLLVENTRINCTDRSFPRNR
jgi:hypothetical protein